MKILKPLRLSFVHRTFEHKRRCLFVPTVMALFPFDSPKSIGTEVDLWKMASKELGRFGVLDHCMWKPRGELLVTGHCYPPGRKEAPYARVKVSLGTIDKTLYVIGDRTWGLMGPSDPVPFTQMRIDWAHAFGGEKYPQNPVGKGLSPIKTESGQAIHPLPNVEDPRHVVKSKGDRPEPAGLGPYDLTWPHHFAKMGTYDKKWLEEQFPGFALDIDFGVFNVAPPDQRLEGYFRGDETFRIENMHPDESVIESQLPGVVARCFLQLSPEKGDDLVEVPLHLETVQLFPHLGRGIVMFRGLHEIEEPDASDVRVAMAALEDLGDEPKPRAHYEQVFAQRMDRKNAHLHILRDPDLMPRSLATAPKAAPVLADEYDQAIEQEMLVLKNARRKAQAELDRGRERAIAMGADPETLPRQTVPPEEEVPSLDDLPAYVDRMNTEADKQKAEAEKKQAEAEQKVRAMCAAQGLDYDEIIRKARREKTGPPKFSAEKEIEKLRDMAELSKNAGVELPGVADKLADPELLDKLRKAEEQVHAAYRIAAHQAEAPAPMEPEESERARAEIRRAYATGERLARRDFSGADLSGIDLSGADLEEVYLEGANLSGANLTGAKLDRAVLARANLTNARLALSSLREANLGRARLEGADFEGADFSGATLHETDAAGAKLLGVLLDGALLIELRLDGADLSGARGEKLFFVKCSLHGVRWAGAKLGKSSFIESNLTDADFTGADLASCTFVGVTADGARFDGANLENIRVVHGSTMERTSFKGAKLLGSNLRGARLQSSDFTEATISKSDLSEADLRGSSLARVIAVDSRFIGTDLRNARCVSANLMLGIMHKARLAGADFTGANLFAADLLRAVGDDETRFDQANLKRVVHQRSAR